MYKSSKFLVVVAMLFSLTACESMKSYDFSIPYFSKEKSDDAVVEDSTIENGAVEEAPSDKNNTAEPSGVSTNTEIGDDFVPPHILFNKYAVISINASEIEIDNRYEMSRSEPHVEHFFPISLETTMKNLIDSKLLALGNSNKLRVVIDDLSVIREKLPEDTSFIGTFRKQPTHVLKSRVVMRFELVDKDRPDVILGHSTLVAKRDKPIFSGMSVAEKEHVYYQLTESLVDDVYKGFADTVQKYFGMEKF